MRCRLMVTRHFATRGVRQKRQTASKQHCVNAMPVDTFCQFCQFFQSIEGFRRAVAHSLKLV
jgi:hypothetical protein